MSFASSSLRRVRGLAPAVPTVYLMQRIPLRLRDGVPPGPADAVGPSLRALRTWPTYVERAHAHDAPVHVWTVDDPEDVDYVVELGVDVIITNRPAEVRQQLLASPAHG
jgi:glycerophosphoryl diester phosphodiesterase